MLWEPGFLSYAPGSESAHMFHLSHFHRLVSFCWFGFGCWGGFVCFAFAFFLSTDQSVRSSCQPMTSLAYFHDCHCRYDERSIVQKKKWLVGIDVEHGPDGRSFPTFLKQNFNGQEAADLYQAVHLHTLEDLAEQGPYPKVISQFALRIITYEYPLEAILAIYFLSVTGHLPDKFPHDQWIEAVRWHGDTKIAAIIHTEAEWADAKIILATLENVVVEAESQHGVVVWSSAQNCPPTIPTDSYPLQLIVLPGEEIQRHLPETLHVEATGLGGRDLSYPIPWDISIRSDKEGQSVYGPSLAPMEETVAIPGPFGGSSQTLQATALGRSKAAHEFLVLRYFRCGQCHALGCTHVGSPACGSAPGCLSPPGHCIGNVWCLAHRTVPPQDASCVVDRLNDLDLEPFDGR